MHRLEAKNMIKFATLRADGDSNGVVCNFLKISRAIPYLISIRGNLVCCCCYSLSLSLRPLFSISQRSSRRFSFSPQQLKDKKLFALHKVIIISRWSM